MDAEEAQGSLYHALLDRLRSLEASHASLREQFDMMVKEQSKRRVNEDGPSDSGETVSYSGWGCIPGLFSSGSPHRNVLEHMGQAVHVSRVESGEIIYWNHPAKRLYGYEDYEALGQRVIELLIDEQHHASAKKIMDKLRVGQSWSGQFPFKKRSGEIFMAIVTKSPLYEEGELVGVITVSSDAAVFNNINSENMRTYRDRANGQPRVRGLNLKKIQWHPQPQIASSVSNLASKVLSRKSVEDTSNVYTCSKDREDNVLDKEDVKLDKPPKIPILHARMGTTDVGSLKTEELASEFSQPTKIAAKDLSKLHTGGITSHAKEKDGSIQQCDLTDAPISNEVIIQPSCPRDLKATTSSQCVAGAEPLAQDPFKRNSTCAAKRVDSNANGPRIPNCFEGHAPVEASSRECNDSSEGDHLSRLGFHFDAEIKNAVQQQTDHHQFPSSGGSIGSSPRSSSSKGDNESNLVVDCEIHWEDLHLREEIGQGSCAVVYRGIWNGSDVAIKVFLGNDYSEGSLLDYKKEIDIMRRLRHPNVLLFMGAVYSQEKEKLAIVTEFLPRGSLFKTLHKNNQLLDIRRHLRMALDVARGMNYLHHRNPPIVHRDLKSSNLLVDKNWTVKVGDFGLSRMKNATFLTAKSGRGTPQWMAPEVLRNEPSNEKSDVFSFGVILWELMTESIPWNHLNSLQVVRVVGFMDRRLDLPENLDSRVSLIIRDCWQSNPEHRPSFEDLILRMVDLIQTFVAPVRRISEP